MAVCRSAGRPGPPPFETVLQEHGPALLRFCVSQVGADRGEDVFQEVMLSALRAYGTVRDRTAIRSWLFSIAARKAIDAHRATARAPVPTADVEPARAATPTAPEIDDPELWTDVAALPDKQRQAIALRFIGDLSHREVAAAMGISEAAARRNVFEGLTALRRTREP